MAPPPTWLPRLPVSRRTGKRILALDNNVVSNYYFETPRDDVRFVFEDANVELHISRQVIDEALNHPGLAVANRQLIWQQLGQLQASGKLVLSGLTHMTPPQQADYRELHRQLSTSGLSAPDARVVADAMVKRLLLLTLEQRLRTGLTNALRNANLQRFLASRALPNAMADILVD